MCVSVYLEAASEEVLALCSPVSDYSSETHTSRSPVRAGCDAKALIMPARGYTLRLEAKISMTAHARFHDCARNGAMHAAVD